VIAGSTVQLTANPLDQNGVAFVGATTTFASSDLAVATVDSATGLVTGVAPGTATITATSVSGSVTVTGTTMLTVTSVTAPIITGLSGSSTTTVGQTETVTVNALDPQNGNLSYSVDWGDTPHMALSRLGVLPPFIQTATFSHVYSAPGTYTAVFTVSNDGGEIASSSMDITVTSDLVLSSVNVTPATSSILVGGTQQLTAAPMDQNGVAFVGATTTFASSDTTVATVDSTTGMVTGVAPGTATITATSVSGSVTVTGTATVTVGKISILSTTTSHQTVKGNTINKRVRTRLHRTATVAKKDN
jgi:uncharacterized protein YjdB